MVMACLKSGRMAALVPVVLFAAATAVSAQTGLPPCATKLLPCAGYLNSTSPPVTCCKSIEDAVANQLTCLCNLYNNPQLLKSFNVDPSQAFALSNNCGLKTDASACNKAVAAPGPTAGGPPGTSGGNKAATGLRSIGLSGLVGLFFLWVASLIV